MNRKKFKKYEYQMYMKLYDFRTVDHCEGNCKSVIYDFE